MILIHPQPITLVSSNVPAGDNQTYMFDGTLNRQTENPDLIEVEIDFSNCDRIALFNLDATSVDIELTDHGTSAIVQSKSIDLETSLSGEYSEYIVEPMYIYADATLKISIHNLGSDAKCGVCAIGLSTFIGATRYGVKIGFVDYSIKDTNEFGQTYLAQGNWAKSPEIQTIVDYDTIEAVYEDLTDARGRLVILEGNQDDTDFEALRVYGFLEDWRIRIDNKSVAWANMTIRGVI